MPVVLSREQFREGVLRRDQGKCVQCGRSVGQIDAHHLIDRKLWDDGGYHLDNGVALCAEPNGGCHFQAELTVLTCEELRRAAGITAVLLPEHFAQDEGECYDHWGNQVLPTGVRLKGELFHDAGCQQAMSQAGLLGTFSPYIKFPRSMHLGWSQNLQNNDRRIRNLKSFIGREVVATTKMDGESASLYPDYIHARSLDSKDHASRSVVRAIHGALKHEIPSGWRLCGENLYARHSIPYRLKSHFLLFAIFDEGNYCLSWDETVAYASMIGVGVAPGFERGVPTVPVLYRGIWDERVMRELGDGLNPETDEGYVVRLAERFHFAEWRHKVGKFVRKEHVRTDEHWMRNWQPNELDRGGVS